MRDFVEAEAKLRVPTLHRTDFVEDVLEDLEQMDESRLVGLGVTPEQLWEWKSQR